MIGQPTLIQVMKRTAALAGLCVMLSDCASHTWESEIDRTAYACSQYGFYPGSKEWDDCLKFVEARRAKRLGF